MTIHEELTSRMQRWSLIQSQHGVSLIPLDLVRVILEKVAPDAAFTSQEWLEVYQAFSEYVPAIAKLALPESEQPPTDHSEWVTEAITDLPRSELVKVTVYLGAVDSEGNPVHEGAPSIEVYVPSSVPEGQRVQNARGRVDFEAWADSAGIPLDLLTSKSKKAKAEVAAIVSSEPPAAVEEATAEDEVSTDGSEVPTDHAASASDPQSS